jgi:hypothetical protein
VLPRRPQRPGLAQCPDYFLDEEGVPLGFLGDQGADLVGKALGVEHGLSHPDALRRGQGGESDPRVVRPVTERMDVAGAIGEDEQPSARREAIGDEGQVLLRRRVHPLGVLEDDDLRPDLGGAQREAAEGVEDLRAALLGIHGEDGSVSGAHGEEEAEIRQQRAQVLAQAEHAPLDLLDHRLLWVPFIDPKGALEQVDQRVKGARAAERQRVPLEPGGRVAQLATELQEEAGLADPRLADDEDHLPLPRLGLLECVEEDLEFALATDERREPPLGFDLQPRSGTAGGDHLPRPDRLAPALHRELAEWPGVEVAAGEPVRGLGDHDASGIGDLLEPGSHVRRVAHRRVIHPEVAADAADEDKTRIEPLTRLEGDAALPLDVLLIARQSLADSDGCVDRPLCVVLVGDWGAEERHDAIAQELVHRALVAVDLGQHQIEGPRHQLMDVFGIQPLGQRREAGDVGEEDGQELALALERTPGGQDLLGEVLGRVAAGRGEAGCNRREAGNGRAASVAELAPAFDLGPAGRAGRLEGHPTLPAELGACPILGLATGTLHRSLLSPQPVSGSLGRSIGPPRVGRSSEGTQLARLGATCGLVKQVVCLLSARECECARSRDVAWTVIETDTLVARAGGRNGIAPRRLPQSASAGSSRTPCRS